VSVIANDELPEGWAVAKFGNVVTLKTGPFGSSLGKKDYVDGGIPVVNPMHIQDGRIVPKDSAQVSKQTVLRLSEFRLSKGDVVLGRRGEMGRCAVVDEVESGWLCGTGSLIVRPSTSLLPNYLQRFLSSPLIVAELIGASVGSTMVNLNQRILADLNVPVPPLAEQKRIADKLEAVLGRVDACRARLDRVPDLLKRFRQCVLAAATSGQLTDDWRKECSVSPWESVTVGDLCLNSFYGPRFGKDEYTTSDKGIPTVRTTDMTKDGRIEITVETPRVLVSEEKLEHFRAQKGDLLITRTGSIGVMAVFDQEIPVMPSAYLIRFRFSERILPRYIFYCLMSPLGQASLGLSTTAVAQPNINAEAIKSIALSLPSIPEQQEIVRRVETLFAFADRIEARLTDARAQVERLTPATLAKAFRGELVPQDPNDEPAIALLERLRESPAGLKKIKSRV